MSEQKIKKEFTTTFKDLKIFLNVSWWIEEREITPVINGSLFGSRLKSEIFQVFIMECGVSLEKNNSIIDSYTLVAESEDFSYFKRHVSVNYYLFEKDAHIYSERLRTMRNVSVYSLSKSSENVMKEYITERINKYLKSS